MGGRRVAERFSLDPDGAKAAGKLLRESGERLLAAHADLVGVLTELDGCWGDDSIGKSFAKNYVPSGESVRDNTEILADNVAAAGQYVGELVDGFLQVDADGAERLDDVLADDIEEWSK